MCGRDVIDWQLVRRCLAVHAADVIVNVNVYSRRRRSNNIV